MKKLIMGLCLAAAAVSVFAGRNKEAKPVPAAPAPKPSSEQKVQKPRYFEGDGGKGLTLAVLAPTGKGLDAEERYWLPLVQGSITGDFNKYSAITIIDRQNLGKILAEQTLSASGNFSEEDYIRIGELANARYILAGSITKTPSGSLIIEFAVSDLESGVRATSFPPKTIPPPDLENLSAVKEASADILGQLGVSLTTEGLRELTKVDDTRVINAETALSKAITTQKNGTVVEALSYYFQALNYDSSLLVPRLTGCLRFAAEAARGSGWLGHSATPHSRAIAPARFAGPGRASCGSDASQSPYSGWQNVVNSRNVMDSGGITWYGSTKAAGMHG